nr:MAG TPA: hypothetical protein [Caudoviricetes sp.]
MERKRVWYAKYIGYCFTDNGKEVVLEDVFYLKDKNGKNKKIIYQLFYPETNKMVFTDLSEMKRIARQTVLPK